MKKSFMLLITILFLSIFSYISILILQTKAISNKNLENQYLYIQAKNHIDFLKNYLNSIELKDIQKIEIKDNIFKIYAKIDTQEEHHIIDMFVKAKNYDISIYEKVVK